MMQTYQSTPDFYRDYIEHRDHKYINKYKNKFGNWVYQYKTSRRAKKVSDARREAGVEADVHTVDILNDKKTGLTKLGAAITVNRGVNERAHFSGKARSYDLYGRDSGLIGSKYVKRENKYTKRAEDTRKNIKKRTDTANKYNQHMKTKEDQRVARGLKSLESKERSLKEASNMYKKRQKNGSSTERFKARMKEKEINEKIKSLRKRKRKLKDSRKRFNYMNNNYDGWNYNINNSHNRWNR